TTKEAAGSTGGKSGKGGDLLYRWGNPASYRAGTQADKRLFGQHNVHWIPKGLEGAGHLLVFNNGDGRPGGAYSTVEELALPMDASGHYALGSNKRFGPEAPVWSYTAPNPRDFYSVNISGAQRLPNGNTLICAGAPGIVFEVTPEKKVVWQYNLPGFGSGRGQGSRNVFRAYRFGPDFPGLSGKTLMPGLPLVDMAREN
ncbi:MAG TPA: aryl-sulfate sulfotransferase, partial [Terriglobia bacterium]|nr:aryl-sulfate sulfotransferase [Terriglobia bacterium]